MTRLLLPLSLLLSLFLAGQTRDTIPVTSITEGTLISPVTNIFKPSMTKYVDTVGAKIIVVDSIYIKTIHGFIVHIYYYGFYIDWQTLPSEEIIYLNDKKKIIDPDIVLKFIPLYPLPDRRPRGM